jgi:hypothetical protein
MTVFLLLQYVQPNLTVLLLSIDFFTQCNLEYVSVVAKDVDRFNKNEEQQGEIKNILQYPKEEMYETIRGHVDLFICLFMYIDSHKYNSFPVVAICTTKFDCSFVVY